MRYTVTHPPKSHYTLRLCMASAHFLDIITSLVHIRACALDTIIQTQSTVQRADAWEGLGGIAIFTLAYTNSTPDAAVTVTKPLLSLTASPGFWNLRAVVQTHKKSSAVGKIGSWYHSIFISFLSLRIISKVLLFPSLPVGSVELVLPVLRERWFIHTTER